jgi:O-methyltransferase/methyltransferase family protein
MNQNIPNVSPELFYETANAFHRTAAIKAAIELEIFTVMGEAANASEIASRCEASERGIRILCDYLTIQGFLLKEGDVYKPTSDTAFFLSKSSPAYIGSAIEFIGSPSMRTGFDHLTQAIRKGGTAIPDEGLVAPEHPMWETFARAMAPMTTLASQRMAKVVETMGRQPAKILDIAAGHGMYGITFARNFPGAQIYAVDWPNVLKVAKTNAERFGVAERYHTISGSAFEVDFGMDYDLALVTNFVHHFDPQTNIRFLKRIFSALMEEGCALTLEMIPNEDRITPRIPAGFSLTMLANTPSGDAYTWPELEEMHLDAGFSKCTLHSLAPAIQSLLLAQK